MSNYIGKSLVFFPLSRREVPLLPLSIGLVALNILDIIFTLKILDLGGTELNPLVNTLLDLGVGYFITVKLTGTVLGAAGLCLCDRFIRTRRILSMLLNLYFFLVLYEIFCYGVLV
ncbi:MAG: DUF5658 family protein [Candidatus Zixiibacteriota bacterium]